MAKATGLGWTTLSVDDITGAATVIKNDVTNLQFSTPRAASDVTGIDKTATERILLLADFSLTLNGQFNGAGVHYVLRTVTSSAVTRTTSMTVNTASLNTEDLYTDYTVARTNTGDLNWSAAASLADGTVPAWS